MSSSGASEWTSDSSRMAMRFLRDARDKGRPVVLLTGAGISVDSGFPLASQLKEYLVQVSQFVSLEGFSNVGQYIEETRWPSRHDLRLDLMLKVRKRSLVDEMAVAERTATQASMVGELRRVAPSLAFSLQEIFGQLDPKRWNKRELAETYGDIQSLAQSLGKRSPRNIAYRSLLFQICDNNQTTIDACFDHFMRDRSPTTTHQFIYFLSQILRTPVIFTTNFDPLLENAFASEGLMPRVYEMQGEGSIPSARLLLSQPLSIVKLHGGTHHMQTGFDLDDPLSPAALASFAELYGRLATKFGQPPLTLVIGYGGSDRRVMDIVTSQIREWRHDTDSDRPRVLWVSRDQWEPPLLTSAVQTHPQVMQGGRERRKDQQSDAEREAKEYRFPAHLVRYRDGRLFLLEALQNLFGHFPIARSHYQAVNFVPHSVSGKDRSAEDAGQFVGDWRLALIHTHSGGGSSSTLVAVAEGLERSADYHTIWIDLTEVVGVSALIDLVSERMTKLDARLQPVRRPPLLQSLLAHAGPAADADAGKRPAHEAASERHELLGCVQWLRSALRRGRYLLALDSLDEFPSFHPALAPDDRGVKPPDLDEVHQRRQRLLMKDLIMMLASDPSLLGDSRVAIALSTVEREKAGATVDPAKVDESQDGRSADGESKQVFHELARDLVAKSGNLLVRAPKLHYQKFKDSKVNEVFVTLGDPSKWNVRSSASPNYVAVAPGGGSEANATATRPPAAGSEKTERRQCEFELSVYKRQFLYTIIILIACCSRRIRSEVLLTRCVSEYLGRILRQGEQRPSVAPDVNEFIEKHLVAPWVKATPDGRGIELFGERCGAVWEQLWNEPGADKQHLNDKAIPELQPDVLQCIHEVSEHAEPPTQPQGLKISENRRWLYRTEGAYHWMHRDIRNGVYEALRTGKNYEQLAMAHHVIALFCYDELYERSRDSRAFLEYLFHRIASIRLAEKAGQLTCALGWLTRLLISLHREKHALMTRVRLPGFMRQIAELKATIRTIKGSPNDKAGADKESRADDLMSDLLLLESDFLLASGHPHSAFANNCDRFDPDRRPVGLPKAGAIESLGRKAVAKLNKMAARKKAPEVKALTPYRDMAYACHDPLLSPVAFPKFPSDAAPPDWAAGSCRDDDDWLALMEKLPEGKGPRDKRLRFCRSIYEGLAAVRAKPFKGLGELKVWTDHDEPMNFFSGLVRKLFEFKLLYRPETWIDSSKTYLRENPKAQKLLEQWRENLPVNDPLGDAWPLKPDDVRGSWELSGDQPLLRRTGKRLRHECYRLCQLARLEAAKHLRVDKPDSVRHQLLITPGKHDWERIRRFLADAESVVDRMGGPAERQAMSITRLITAELLVRRAEILSWAIKDPTQRPKQVSTMESELWGACEKSLVEAFSTLSTVDRMMNEGRGENRWRFFYLLTLGRAHLLRGYLHRETARRSALLDMTQAAKHITGALNNCGMWTDRYDVLLWWWDTWRAVAAMMFSPDHPEELETYLCDMYARLGLRWYTEPCASRFDRYYPVNAVSAGSGAGRVVVNSKPGGHTRPPRGAV